MIIDHEKPAKNQSLIHLPRLPVFRHLQLVNVKKIMEIHRTTLNFSQHKKCSPLRISSVNMTKSTFTEEILNGKLHFFCAVFYKYLSRVKNPKSGEGLSELQIGGLSFKNIIVLDVF